MHLAAITLYPIKSLEGVRVPSATITPGGTLRHDRTYALFDEHGAIVNGKRTPRIHTLRATFDPTLREVRLHENGATSAEQFPLDAPAGAERWLTAYFGFPITLRADFHTGFPDDLVASGPTIVSQATLETVTSWYPGLTLESARARFRTNLELTGGPPFCEDRLYGPAGEVTPFRLGSVSFLGHNPCQRCAVPARDATTGRATPRFQQTFLAQRRQTLPPWAEPTRFNHYYRLAVNTTIPPTETTKTFRVGDELLL